MSNKTYVIILNYNGWQDTIECLESILKSDYDNYQIVVVDNNSSNNSMNYLIKWAKGELNLWLPNTSPFKNLLFPLKKKPIDYIFYTQKEALKGGNPNKEDILKNPIIFIQAEENRGFGAGNNIGIKYALAKDDFEYIWFLNNDTIIKKDTLKKLVKNHTTDTLLSSRLMKNKKLIQADGGKLNKFFLTTSHIHENRCLNDKLFYIKPDYLVGASLFLDKKSINKIGLWDEEYFLYYEDVDYSLRALIKGFKLRVVYDSLVFHKENASTKKVNQEFILNLYFKNRIRLARKFKFNLFFVKCGLIISIIKRCLNMKLKECKIIKGQLFNG